MVSLMYSVATYTSNSVLNYNLNLQQFVVPRLLQAMAFVQKFSKVLQRPVGYIVILKV